MVTRGKARAGGVKKTVVRVRSIVADQGEGSQRNALAFEAAWCAGRKRKAEESVDENLAEMAATITELMRVRKQMAEGQRSLLESIKVLMESNKAMAKTIKAQAEVIKAGRSRS